MCIALILLMASVSVNGGRSQFRANPWARNAVCMGIPTARAGSTFRNFHGGPDEILPTTTSILWRHRSACQNHACLRRQCGRQDTRSQEYSSPARLISQPDRPLSRRNCRRRRMHVRLVLVGRFMSARADHFRSGACAVHESHSWRKDQER